MVLNDFQVALIESVKSNNKEDMKNFIENNTTKDIVGSLYHVQNSLRYLSDPNNNYDREIPEAFYEVRESFEFFIKELIKNIDVKFDKNLSKEQVSDLNTFKENFHDIIEKKFNTWDLKLEKQEHFNKLLKSMIIFSNIASGKEAIVRGNDVKNEVIEFMTANNNIPPDIRRNTLIMSLPQSLNRLFYLFQETVKQSRGKDNIFDNPTAGKINNKKAETVTKTKEVGKREIWIILNETAGSVLVCRNLL